ncbi:MAG: maltose alpha-D-glucosyltransferase [Candidatus Tectimicrobiota bacterium]
MPQRPRQIVDPGRASAHWYSDAIIYEVHVRAFYDSNGDGIGDFPGLTQKLDYLHSLGVTALWLLPFYPSPLKDDGYDIADYTAVHPAYGTLQDFKVFLKAAHRRGLKVITELVLNHTSDQHPWFQRARRAPPGGFWRQFYVWSETPEPYQDARVIFQDFEASNWSWDPVANAYYWHRFYAHQPDLNYDHPPVRQAILRVVDFWLGLGVDGLRLDAVPYLFEREGTTGENLPETHAALRQLRRYIDQHYPQRMLLAEANQWPEEAVAYFGRGDECHMVFHFPLMPRLFMALQMEDRFPILDILEQTPPIPSSCQWAVFLRNHDELTLEMVTEEERLYMYRAYAPHPEAKVNLGIRRRLAPLLHNHRPQIELLNGLLFSLIGTPVLYYGDEIGMGDNIYLGDRNGVRTPMQWSADRNAGFSQAHSQQLYLPLIVDHEYHHESLHVEAQQHNPYSLLHWMQRLIALRKGSQALRRGRLTFVPAANPSVLVFLRHTTDEQLLVVANLSRFLQHVELDLAAWSPCTPVEVFGRRALPSIGTEPYPLTVGPHSFYWLALRAPEQVARPRRPTPAQRLPLLTVETTWEEVLRGEAREALEALLPAYLRTTPWCGRQAVPMLSTTVVESIALPLSSAQAYLTLVHVQYSSGEPQLYAVPLAYATGTAARHVRTTAPHAILARLRHAGTGSSGYLYDPLWSAPFATALLQAVVSRRRWAGQHGVLEAEGTPVLRAALAAPPSRLTPTVLPAAYHNTSVVYGTDWILKLFRCVDVGLNPDLELGRFLTAQGFAHTPAVVGALAYRPQRGERLSVAIVQRYVPHRGSLAAVLQSALQAYFQRLPGRRAPSSPPLGVQSVLARGAEVPSPAVQDLLGEGYTLARLLGQRTAAMHLTLAASSPDTAFTPLPFTPFYQRALYQSSRGLIGRVLEALQTRWPRLPVADQHTAGALLARRAELLQCCRQVALQPIQAQRLRCHGDYHLGQILVTDDDLMIVDFEGLPQQRVSERQLKRSPLMDVASMLWSLQAAPARARPRDRQDSRRLEAWAQLWAWWSSHAFVHAYLATAAAGTFLPATPATLGLLLEHCLLASGLMALATTLDTQPQDAGMPLEGLLHLLEASRLQAE